VKFSFSYVLIALPSYANALAVSYSGEHVAVNLLSFPLPDYLIPGPWVWWAIKSTISQWEMRACPARVHRNNALLRSPSTFSQRAAVAITLSQSSNRLWAAAVYLGL